MLDLAALDLPSSAAGTTTVRSLRKRGFSGRASESFFRPFFGGLFLDPRLNAPLRWFEFLFAMFATGSATLPADGMLAIPQQLAAGLPASTVRRSALVRAIRSGRVELATGEVVAPRAIILATDARHAADAAPRTARAEWRTGRTPGRSSPAGSTRRRCAVGACCGSRAYRTRCHGTDPRTPRPPRDAIDQWRALEPSSSGRGLACRLGAPARPRTSRRTPRPAHGTWRRSPTAS